MKEQQIEMGDLVQDLITGFSGIVTAKTEWFNGCIRYALQGPTQEGKIPESQWVDEPQLIVIKKQAINRQQLLNGNGGPQKDPKFLNPKF
jgi:hypothetical protein